MEFGLNREGFVEEDQKVNKVRYFSYSSSSSPSSSSSQYKPQPQQQLTTPLHNNNRWESSSSSAAAAQIYDNQQQMGSWLSNKYDPSSVEEDNSIEESASTKLDLMEASPRNEDDAVARTSTAIIEKEHMFDKVVTPSDVGKLNRLVIPKQHAEKYFPLDSSTNEKGLLLNFEDRHGKPWRFRYSYWNSSQSYVMTKGWSRFVKDKKLDAGDIVSFQRGIGELGKDRLYIDWRRRPDAPDPSSFHPLQHHLSFHRSMPWSPLLMRPPQAIPAAIARDQAVFPQVSNYNSRNGYYNTGAGYGGGSVFYLRPQMVEWQQQQQQAQLQQYHHSQQQQHHHHPYHHHHEQQQQPLQQQHHHPVVYDSVPVVQGKAAAKRMRLFGVNMECPITESDECDILSSTTVQQPSQLSSSTSSQSPLQLRLYNGTPMPPPHPHPIDFLNKGKSSMSFETGHNHHHEF